jgi:Glycosyltransferase family 87
MMRRGPIAVQTPEAVGAIAISAVAFALVAFLNIHSTSFGFDFRGNPWDAARAVLHGHSPYAHMTTSYFRSHSNSYLLPPLFAELAAPLGALPFGVAFGLWTGLSVAAFIAALYLVGLRSKLCFALALLSFPLLDNLVLGQLSAFMALGYALVWRYRDRRYLPGFLVAFLIVLKLLAWPLLIWLAVSKRGRAAVAGLLTVPLLAAASWAIVGFHGLPDLFRGLSIDARLSHSHSVTSVLVDLGLPHSAGVAAAFAVGVLLVGWAVWTARRGRDTPAFAAAIAAGIYASPLVHPHYLLLVIVALAIAQPRPTWSWLALLGLWFSTSEPPSSPANLYAAFVVALAIVGSTLWSADRTEAEVLERSVPIQARFRGSPLDPTPSP